MRLSARTLYGGNVTYLEAREVAQRHVAESPIEHPDYRMGVAEGRILPEGWYFDYIIEPTKKIQESEREHFAGAPGFIVSKNGEPVRIVSWSEFTDRNLGKAPFAS